jgi:hypothetical protein|nr:MAG TPA: hypothetical protein [Caudoviricetes sp.]
MSWVYKPSGGVVGLARKAGELYGGTVRLETFAGGVVRCYFDDLHWFTFRFHSEEAGLSALYPVHGIEWEMWGEKYIFRNADEVRDRIISVGPVTDAERDNRANQEIAHFLDTHLLEVRERPVQKYELVREGAMWRLEPLVYMGTWKGGLVDGPAVVPHHGKAWVGGSSRVEGVRLGSNAEVLYSSRVSGENVKLGTSGQIWLLGDVYESVLHLQAGAQLAELSLVHHSRVDGKVLLGVGAGVIDSLILGHDHYSTHIPDGVSINEANLHANEFGRLPFIQVSNVGALWDELSVWYDGVKKQVRVHIGSFYGSAVEFLEKTKKEYESLLRYRARAHESDASELMMYQDLVPCLAAAVMDIKNEGEREKDNGNYNGEA